MKVAKRKETAYQSSVVEYLPFDVVGVGSGRSQDALLTLVTSIGSCSAACVNVGLARGRRCGVR